MNFADFFENVLRASFVDASKRLISTGRMRVCCRVLARSTSSLLGVNLRAFTTTLYRSHEPEGSPVAGKSAFMIDIEHAPTIDAA